MNQITGLLDRGHEVDIYAYGRGDNLMINGDIEKYNLLKHTFYYGDFIQLITSKYIGSFHKSHWTDYYTFSKETNAFGKIVK